MAYLELLQNFENNRAVSEIIREELQNKSSFNHKITFFYKDRKTGEGLAQKAMAYINANPYYNEKVQIYTENAKERIAKNQELLTQADQIINNYSSKLTSKPEAKATERIVLDNEEQVDITELLQYKNALIRDIEIKKLELLEQSATAMVINFGKPQIVQKSLFGKNIVLIPLVLVGLFFLFSFLRYLNNKSENFN
jgi:hypothetical protein